MSSSILVESGVPQGGVLSGTLFSLYINDLPNVFQTCKVSLYADDAKIYAPINNDKSIQAVQNDIDKLANWCKKWRLNLNPGKCFQLQYNPRSTERAYHPVYTIDGHTIERRSEGKDLGVMINEDLKFHKHVNKISDRCNKEINRIRRSFTTRTPTFLTDMYKLYVRPHMEYCVEMWNPGYQGDKKKLELVQNKMTRLLNLGHQMRPEERNTMMGLTSHENRRKRGDMIATFKNFDNPNLFEIRTSSRTRGNDKTRMMTVARIR